MRSLTNHDIDNYFRGEIGYIGCLIKDQLPLFSANNSQTRNPIEFGVINLDDNIYDETRGTHWIAFFHDNSKDVVFYFDSFGRHLDPKIAKFLKKRYRKKILHQTNAIQDLKSNLCGYYCVEWIDFLRDGGKYLDFLKKFTKNGTENDEILLRMLESP